MSTPPDLQQLFALFNARRFADMEALARTLLAREPQSGLLWKSLGIALQVQGKDALPTLERAAALLPQDPELPSNMGSLLSAAGHVDEAVASFRRAIALKPDFAEAHGNLGLTLTRAGRLDEAISSLGRAVQLMPRFTEAHANLGNALMLSGRPEEAAQSFTRALALQPRHLRAHTGLAAAHASLGRLDEAMASYRRAAQLRPDLPGLQFDLGSTLLALGRNEDALPCLRAAVQQDPARVPALGNLGLALANLGQLDEAVSVTRRALELAPDSADLLNNLGNALKAQGDSEAALACYRRAPGHPASLGNEAVIHRERGELEAAAACYERLMALDPQNFAARSDLIFVRSHEAGAATTLLQQYGAAVAAAARPSTDWPCTQTRAGGRPLRIGFVSADLRAHPVGYFLQGLLAGLSAQVEVFAYANARAFDATSAAIRARCRQWREISGLGDEAAARLIREEDQIDVLIDLAGHTAGNRLPLFAWRPAPVQASWLGYCGSTGVAAIDHFIADPWIAPAGAEHEFSESLLRLPETFLCFTPPADAPPVAPRPARPLTFGSFNKLNKISEAVFATWARVLLAVPGSRLHLKTRELDTPALREALLQRFAAQGIAAERLVLEGATAGRAAHLARYAEIDIALDPFPYPGTTTTVEGLWMGVPALTLRGERALGRQGESLLHNLGMSDWIADDAADYVARAARLAGALPDRTALRQRLLASPLCDAGRFAAHFEAALRSVLQ